MKNFRVTHFSKSKQYTLTTCTLSKERVPPGFSGWLTLLGKTISTQKPSENGSIVLQMFKNPTGYLWMTKNLLNL